MLALVSACGTAGTPKLVPVSNACLVGFKEIKYAIQPNGTPDNEDNIYDTQDTVTDVQDHNVIYRSVCPDTQD